MFEHRNNFLSKIEKRISEGIGNVLAAQSSAHARRTDPSALYTFGRNDEGVLFLCGFKDERRVSEIEVPEGIGAVYEGAFMGCGGITKLILPEGLTYVCKQAFKDCKGLKCVIFRAPTVVIGESAFEGCSALESIIFEGQTVSAEMSAFSGCGVRTLRLPPVAFLGAGAFSNCRALAEVSFAPASSEGYRLLMGDFCFSCTGLRDIAVPSGDVTLKNNVFFSCHQLKHAALPEGIMEIPEQLFLNCTSLESVVIPESAEAVGRAAFFKCRSLKSVYIPDRVRTIGSGAFAYCGSLDTVRLPITAEICDLLAVDGRYGRAFYGLADSVNVTAGRHTYAFSEIITPSGLAEKVVGLALEGDENALKDVDENAAPFIRNILRQSFDTIGGNDLCRLIGLLSAENRKLLKRDKTYKIVDLTEFGETWLIGFNNGCSVKKLVIPAGVTHIANGAFKGCEEIESVRFPLSLRCIGEAAFEYCSALKTVTLPENIEEIDSSAFARCESLKSAELKNSSAVLGQGIFVGCTALESAVLPEGMTRIPASMFYCCEALTEAELPDTVTSIGTGAFGHTAISSAVLPGNIVSIGESAFYGCDDLKEAVLPKSVKSIGDGALGGCKALGTLSMELNAELDMLFDYKCIASYRYNRSCPDHIRVNGKDFELSGRLDTYSLRRIADKLAAEGDPTAITINEALAPEYAKINRLTGHELFGLRTFIDDDGNELIMLDCLSDGVSADEARIPDGTAYIAKEAFYRCSGVKRLIVPESVRYIGNNAFRESGFEEIVFEDRIAELRENMFTGCPDLRKIKFREGLEIIGEGAFALCPSLAAIVLPDSVKTIRHRAFSGCRKLRSVKLPLCRIIDSSKEYQKPFGSCTALELALIEGREYKINSGFNMTEMSRIAADLLCEGNENARVFMRENGEYALRKLTKHSEILRVERLLSEFGGFTLRQIDSAVNTAIQSEQHEIYLALIEYKRKNLGFDDAPRFEL